MAEKLVFLLKRELRLKPNIGTQEGNRPGGRPFPSDTLSDATTGPRTISKAS